MDGPQVSKMGQIKKMNDHYYTNKVVFDLIKCLHLFIKARAETEKKNPLAFGKIETKKNCPDLYNSLSTRVLQPSITPPIFASGEMGCCSTSCTRFSCILTIEGPFGNRLPRTKI